MKAQIRGVHYHIMTFDFFYGLALGECVLRHADCSKCNSSKAKLGSGSGTVSCTNDCENAQRAKRKRAN